MAEQITNYKCPACTGPLHFVGASGKLECDYCGASYDVAQIEALYAEKEGKAAAAQQSAEEKAAAEKKTAEQGVVIAMDNIVVNARDVMKSNTVQPETFVAGNFGKVGTIFNNKVTYESKSLRKHTYETPFDVTKLTKLPKVGIVYTHGGVEGIQAQALVDAKYDGIVNAGVGNGNLHKAIFPILEKAAKNGIAVVRSSRVPTGATTKDAEVDDNKYGFVSSGTLNPQKARILLQLGLTKTHDYKKLQDYFDQY